MNPGPGLEICRGRDAGETTRIMPDRSDQGDGASPKTVLTEKGAVRIDVPRDRQGSFEPLLIPKHERRFTGFDDKIIAMYARGMSVREIQGFIAERYGTQVSPDFISSVTEEVMAEAIAWQSRPLEQMYPVVFFDALRVKIRTDGGVSNKAVYLALGVQADGQRDVLGVARTGSPARNWRRPRRAGGRLNSPPTPPWNTAW
jgi:transposase-like protein